MTDKSTIASQVRGLHHVGLVVPNLEKALRFYCDVLGFRLLFTAPSTQVDGSLLGFEGGIWLSWAYLDAGASIIELHEFQVPEPEWHARIQPEFGVGHIALRVIDIEAAWEELRQHGVEFFSRPQVLTEGPQAGNRWVYGRDPFGVAIIELYQETGGGSLSDG